MKEKNTRRRTLGRAAAVQAIFQMNQTKESFESVINQFTNHRLKDTNDVWDDADKNLFCQIVTGVAKHLNDIEESVRSILTDEWKIERIDPVAKAILFAGIFEMMWGEQPHPIIINEYIDVAHGFCEPKIVQFVNASLDSIAKKATL